MEAGRSFVLSFACCVLFGGLSSIAFGDDVEPNGIAGTSYSTIGDVEPDCR